MKRLMILLIVFSVSSCACGQSFIQLTDEQQIELSIDMIRKGIQQEDPEKVLLVSDSSVKCGDVRLTALQLRQELGAAFEMSHQAKTILEAPKLKRQDTHLTNSAFWDFSIENVVITIFDDSAIVNCDIVMWHYYSYSKELIIPEKLVFYSRKTESEQEVPNMTKWKQSEVADDNSSRVIKNWRLGKFEKLLQLILDRYKD